MRAEGTMGSTMKTTATLRKLLTGIAALVAVGVVTETAQAQEILLTGPLAGAPAVRKLRLYREKRIEVAPAVSFTLLDEYQREILFGARLNYNLTDWLAVGAFGAYGAIKLPTGLSEKIQDVNDERRRTQPPDSTDRRLTAVNLGPDFTKQLGSMDWVLAPQLTGVPFRGKLALFQNIYVDTDLYFFAGPAFIGLSERKDCPSDCGNNFDKASRVAVAPTFGLGFTFYANKWNALGFEWRALPFSWNTGGFDTKGGGKDQEFPDNKIDDKDRLFRFNQFLTLSWNLYFPQEYRVSE
jgi:outer membrane beta-barrel protein